MVRAGFELNGRGKVLAGSFWRESLAETGRDLLPDDGFWDLGRLQSDEDFRGFAEAVRAVVKES